MLLFFRSIVPLAAYHLLVRRQRVLIQARSSRHGSLQHGPRGTVEAAIERCPSCSETQTMDDGVLVLLCATPRRTLDCLRQAHRNRGADPCLCHSVHACVRSLPPLLEPDRSAEELQTVVSNAHAGVDRVMDREGRQVHARIHAWPLTSRRPVCQEHVLSRTLRSVVRRICADRISGALSEIQRNHRSRSNV